MNPENNENDEAEDDESQDTTIAFEMDDYEVDDDGSVDRKIKDRILKARENIDEAERLLFVEAPVRDDMSVDRGTALHSYATMVKQYIRTILPLLNSDKVKKAEFYRDEVPIYEDEVPPPDGTYDWSEFYYAELDASTLAYEMGLPPGFSPPEAKEITLTGLSSILTRTEIQLRWTFNIQAGPGGYSPEMETLTRNIRVPKEAYERTTEHADQFLQQAGVGLEIDGGRPRSNYSK